MPGEGPWLVVGLGNPGPAYSGNRHNVGFMVVDLLATRMSGRFKAHKSRAEILEGRLAGRRVVLAKPRTYMNESGGPVTALADFFTVPIDRLVVVHDELDLPVGRLKIKQAGGLAGNNGLKSLKSHLHSADFTRIRVGIGKPPGRQSGADYVLRKPGKAERTELDISVAMAADAVEAMLADGVAEAMNIFNRTDRD